MKTTPGRPGTYSPLGARPLILWCSLLWPIACPAPSTSPDAGSTPDGSTPPLVCTWEGEERPDVLTHLGCPADFDAVAAVPLDTSIAGAFTVKFVVDRASLSAPDDPDGCAPACTMPEVCAEVDEQPSCQSYQVYFQNTEQRALHWMFARDLLSGTCACREECVDSCDCDTDTACQEGCRCDTDCDCLCAEIPRRCSLPPVMDLATFNGTEYIMPHRRFLLGSITYFVEPDIYALNLAPVDTASPEMIERMFRIVADATFFGPQMRFLPQSVSQEQRAEELPSDIPQVTSAEIYAGLTYQPLNLGETIGQLRRLRADDLDDTYVSPRDIVVLDAVPNDITPVAGIVTGEFQTPLSHINVLSQNRGTPNMALRGAFQDPTLRDLDGRWVRLTVGANAWSAAEVSYEEAEAWWRDHRPPPLEIPAVDFSARTLLDIEEVSVEQVTRVGAKAANFGELQRMRLSPRRYPFDRTDDLGVLPDSWIAPTGTWVVAEHPDATSGGQMLEQRDDAGGAHAAFAADRWRNFSCRLNARLDDTEAGGIAFLHQASGAHYLLRATTSGEVRVELSQAGQRQVLATTELPQGTGLFDLEVRLHDRELRARACAPTSEPPDDPPDGSCAEIRLILDDHPPGEACGAWTDAGSRAEFDDLEITPIFNPRGFTIPFSFFRTFMRQSGFDVRLAVMLADPRFRADGLFRRDALETLREDMEAAPIGAELWHQLDEKLRAEFPGMRMRFRSSTNAEDLGSYSGAGLYSSRSGQLDDPDRPVDAAVKRVWASLFNLRAFEEREWLGIPHHRVAMAVLVHRSYPDELANGVAITANLFDPSEPAFYVNVQLGEESVTNPEPGVLPDQFLYYWAGLNPEPLYLSYSTLNDGEPVMSRREIHELARALLSIHNHFQPLYGARPGYAMDVEFKLDSPDRALVIKQARPFPGRGEHE